ncbi:uncharacterized protein [Dysidea avara]
MRAVGKQEFAGSCKLVCIEFVPLHDKQQCLWAAQWVLASQGAGLLSHVCKTFSCRSDTNAISIIDHPIPDHSGTASAIYRYFTSKTNTPTTSEGYTEQFSVSSQLICNSQYEFTIPALFIQWECLVGEAGSAVMEACFYWQVTNEIGRVIVLCYNKDGAHNDWKEIVQVICRLVESHPQLVVYYIISSGVSSLADVIAWLQHSHTIALYHQATIYVWSSESHCDCVKTLGITHRSAELIAAKPKSITCVHHSTNTPLLMLKKLFYCSPDVYQSSDIAQDSGYHDTYISTWASTNPSSKDTAKHYHLPLYDLASLLYHKHSVNSVSLWVSSEKKHCSVQSVDLAIKGCHVSVAMDSCHHHGLLYNQWAQLEQYQGRAARVVVPVTNKDCSSCFSKKTKADYKGKEKKIPVISSPFVPAKRKPNTGLLSPKPIINKCVKKNTPFPVITHEEVLSHANSNTYARAEAYQDNVFDLNHGNRSFGGEDEFIVTCQCYGSESTPYKAECRLSESGSIVGSNCSCHYGTSNGGRCKHVIAMLLVLMKKQQAKSIAPPAAATCNEQSDVGTLTRNRSLPKWVSETAPAVDENPPTKKRLRTSEEDIKLPDYSKYKMNDEDLLKTALEILEESNTIDKDTQQSSALLPETASELSNSSLQLYSVNNTSPAADYDAPTQEIDQVVDEVADSYNAVTDNMDWQNGQTEYHSYDDVDDDTQELFGLGPSVIEDKPCIVNCDVSHHEYGISHHEHDRPYDNYDSGSDNLLDELFS